jgi:hypothetical protein
VAEHAADVAPVDVLHGDEVLGADAAELEELDDVDVVQQRRELGLADERLDEARVLGQVRQEALERHDPLEALDPTLERAMHGCHAAHTEALVDQVRSELLHRCGVGDHREGSLGSHTKRIIAPRKTAQWSGGAPRSGTCFFRRFHVERQRVDRPFQLFGER